MNLKRNKSGAWILTFWHGSRAKGCTRRMIYKNLGVMPPQAARKKAKEIEGDFAGRRSSGDDRLTFRQLVEKYVAMRGDSFKPRGLIVLESIIRCHLLPFFGEMRVEELTAYHVEQYRKERRQLVRTHGFVKGEKEPPRILTDRPVAIATLNREWAVLRAILRWGKRVGLYDRVPIEEGEVRTPKAKEREVFIEPTEWRALVTAAAADPELAPIVPVLRLALLTASRPSEVLELRWRDVDLERKVLTIRQTKVERSKLLWIVPAVEELLKAQGRGIGEAAVFPGLASSTMSLSYYQTRFRRACLAADVVEGQHGRLIPYATRHTAATWMRDTGVALDMIGEVLGHRDSRVRITLGYVHTGAAATAPALEALARAERAALAGEKATGSEMGREPGAISLQKAAFAPFAATLPG